MADVDGSVAGGGIEYSMAELDGILAGGGIIPVKWEGGCPPIYGDEGRSMPKLVRNEP